MGFKVLDASAFYAGVPFGAAAPSQDGGSWYTTQLVLDEVSHIRGRQDVVGIMQEMGRLRVTEPLPESVRKASEAAKRTGDLNGLSKQDVSVLALGLEMGADVVTDDFAVSNVAAFLGITVMPVMTGGIRHSGTWIHYCPACKKRFRRAKQCPRCATPLRKRLLRKGGRAGKAPQAD